MPSEIERKYLVNRDAWRAEAAGGVVHEVRQGYLSRDPERTVRVRRKGARGYLTIKGKTTGIARAEYEYEIPAGDADALFGLCVGPLVEKRRYVVEYEGHTWEVDDFTGENAGLLLAEIELTREDEPFTTPPWVGEEVSSDPRYQNSNLSVHPFSRWAR